mmetsp:Transcript_32412/g.58944  ORF Transcript_32412/g.58944 Transcript_32412/m.58944 type:complete len:361 (+) Transcript_32412:67-1149(+)
MEEAAMTSFTSDVPAANKDEEYDDDDDEYISVDGSGRRRRLSVNSSEWKRSGYAATGVLLSVGAIVCLISYLGHGHPNSSAELEILDEVEVDPSNVSIYCWAAMLPDSSERGLLEMAASQKQGIFGCDAYAVWSSINGTVGGINISVIENLNMFVGIQPGTGWRMNTPVFQRIWNAIYEEGTWKLHDWTLKFDPDTVVIASRFKFSLAWHQSQWWSNCEKPRGCYLRNCPAYHELYGAAEVLSRNALRTLAEEQRNCWYIAREDSWIDSCLAHLGVQPREEGPAFCLGACPTCNTDPHECWGPHAVWHAAKYPWKYHQCLERQNALLPTTITSTSTKSTFTITSTSTSTPNMSTSSHQHS